MIDANVPHRVLKAGNFSFIVAVGDSEVVCRSRKKVKNNGEILAGDMVYLEQVGEEAVIKGVVPRKKFSYPTRNSQYRPGSYDDIAAAGT